MSLNKYHLAALVALIGLIQIGLPDMDAMLQKSLHMHIHLQAISTTSIVAVAIFIFDRWLWRLPFLYPWFSCAPNVNDRWRISMKILSGSDASSLEYLGHIQLKQTFSSIYFEINWDNEEKSEMTAPSRLAAHESGQCAFSAVYSRTGKDSGLKYAGFFFTNRQRLPKSFIIYYANDKGQFGEAVISEPEKKISWRSFWTR